MKNIKIISLAALLTVGIVGCGRNNGKQDTFTNASVTEESAYKVVSAKADDLIAAMGKYKGTYLHATVNEDDSVDVGYFIYTLVKGEDGSYYINQRFGANSDGSVNQTVKNLERERKGTAYFISHSYGEIEGTPRNVYKAVTGTSAPTWQASKYYSRSGTEGNYSYSPVTVAPSDWSTTYTNYFVVDYIAYDDVGKVDWKSADTPVVGAKMYYTVENLDYAKNSDGKVNSVTAKLKVYRIDPIV